MGSCRSRDNWEVQAEGFDPSEGNACGFSSEHEKYVASLILRENKVVLVQFKAKSFKLRCKVWDKPGHLQVLDKFDWDSWILLS